MNGLSGLSTYPSVYSACRRPKYASHLLPITFPHVKHLIGIIIFVFLEKINVNFVFIFERVLGFLILMVFT